MKFIYPIIFVLLFGCAGIRIPYTHFYLARNLIETDTKKVNIDCIKSEDLNSIRKYLEFRHVAYIRSDNIEDALTKDEIITLLKSCEDNLIYLSTKQIKKELFSDSQPFNPEALKLLGGFSFKYTNTFTESGIQPTFHLEENLQGEYHKLLVIYRLEDNKVIHYNDSGSDKVFEQKKSWPLSQIFEFIFRALGKAVL